MVVSSLLLRLSALRLTAARMYPPANRSRQSGSIIPCVILIGRNQKFPAVTGANRHKFLDVAEKYYNNVAGRLQALPIKFYDNLLFFLVTGNGQLTTKTQIVFPQSLFEAMVSELYDTLFKPYLNCYNWK
jgi:hypothetical protein